MKRSVAFSVMFLFGTLAALAQPAPSHRFSNPLLDDVVAMSRAGLSNATIVAYVQARRARLDSDLSADDLIRLQRAGVSEPVVREIAGVANINAPARGRRDANDEEEEMTNDSGDGGEDYPVGPVTVGGYDYPYYDYLYAYGYPYWYAYSPYFSSSFIFGGRRFFHGGGFVHHSVGHGGTHTSGHSGSHSSGHSSHSSGHSGGGHH